MSCTHVRRRGNVERGVRYHKQASDTFRTHSKFMKKMYIFYISMKDVPTHEK